MTYGGIGIFVFRGVIAYLPAESVGIMHLIFCSLLIVSSFVSFIVLTVSDPGVIKKESIKALKEKYPYDGVLFQETECRTCKIPKIARSRHCSLCNVCIERHDHHCIWVYKCIGAKNYKYFLWFVLSHTIMCIDIAYITAMISILIIFEKKNAFIKISAYMSFTGFLGVWTTIFEDYIERYPDLLFVLLLAIVMAVFLVVLTIIHTVVVLKNKTTNEEDKAYAIEQRLTKTKEALSTKLSKQKVDDKGKIEAEIKEIEKQLKEVNKNYYSKGIMKNIREMLFAN